MGCSLRKVNTLSFSNRKHVTTPDQPRRFLGGFLGFLVLLVLAVPDDSAALHQLKIHGGQRLAGLNCYGNAGARPAPLSIFLGKESIPIHAHAIRPGGNIWKYEGPIIARRDASYAARARTSLLALLAILRLVRLSWLVLLLPATLLSLLALPSSIPCLAPATVVRLQRYRGRKGDRDSRRGGTHAYQRCVEYQSSISLRTWSLLYP